MKSNIDLTSNRDFDPSKFKVKKVQSTYYDNQGNTSKLPWNKEGELYNKHRIRYTIYDNDITWTFDRNLDYTTNWIQSINLTSTNANYTTYQIFDNWGDSWVRFDYNFSTTTTFSTTVPYISSTNSKSVITIERARNTFRTGFRIGKVKDIKQISSRPSITSKYKDLFWNFKHALHNAKNEDGYFKYHKRSLNKIHDLFGKYKSSRFVYTGYESFVDDCSVGTYKEFDEYERLCSDYPICEILDNCKRWIPCIYKSDKVYTVTKRRGITNRADALVTRAYKPKIKWPNFYDDYLRELQGLKPINDWKHGIPNKNTRFGHIRSLDDTGLFV